MTFGLRCSQPARRPHPASLSIRVPTVEGLLHASFSFASRLRLAFRYGCRHRLRLTPLIQRDSAHAGHTGADALVCAGPLVRLLEANLKPEPTRASAADLGSAPPAGPSSRLQTGVKVKSFIALCTHPAPHPRHIHADASRATAQILWLVDHRGRLRHLRARGRDPVLQHRVLLRLLPALFRLVAGFHHAWLPAGRAPHALGRAAGDPSVQRAETDHPGKRAHGYRTLRIRAHGIGTLDLLRVLGGLYGRIHLLRTHTAPVDHFPLVPEESRESHGRGLRGQRVDGIAGGLPRQTPYRRFWI